jgi:hypothetical protein
VATFQESSDKMENETLGTMEAIADTYTCIYRSTCASTHVYIPSDGVFYPSTQRHYPGLILLLMMLHVSVVRPSSGRNILLASITQLATDPLFLDYC